MVKVSPRCDHLMSRKVAKKFPRKWGSRVPNMTLMCRFPKSARLGFRLRWFHWNILLQSEFIDSATTLLSLVYWLCATVAQLTSALVYYKRRYSTKDPSSTRSEVQLIYGIACKNFLTQNKRPAVKQRQTNFDLTVEYNSHVNISKTFKTLAMMS